MTGIWRTLLFASLVAKFYFATQPSYIHPDEFFQSFQILYNDNLPWEVQDASNINRSVVPLLITHYPSIWLGNKLGFEPIQIYMLSRIQMTTLSWIITDWCLYRLIPSKHERIKSLLFTTTSYLTLVHQSHTLSNSLETLLLLLTLYLINDIRFFLEQQGTNYSLTKLAILGTLISFGTFNRITFGAWILIPSFYLFEFFVYRPKRSLVPIVSFILTSMLIIFIDKKYYDSPSWTIAPLNNLIYNMKTSNLAHHGLHSRFTHILVNYPQIVGPLIFSIFPFNTNYIRTIPFLSVVSGFSILSIFPHQELRFLLPSVPLLSSLTSFSTSQQPRLEKFQKLVLPLWIIYTAVMSLIYGLFHQAGIVPSLVELNSILPENGGSSVLYWRTYPAPTWMLSLSQNFEYISKSDDDLIQIPDACSDYFVNMMGVDSEIVLQVNEKLFQCGEVYLVAPKNAMLHIDRPYITIWESFWHLDLDHFEFHKFGIDTLRPGIGIYKLL